MNVDITSVRLEDRHHPLHTIARIESGEAVVSQLHRAGSAGTKPKITVSVFE